MFNILDSGQRIHNHHLIEASAGTGKTFTIENLVVRLLTEPTEGNEHISLDKILVVTFTRAATRDLRKRIRATLSTVQSHIATFIHSGQTHERCPPYLAHTLEEGIQDPKDLLKTVQNALSVYDQAYIDTIHGFCAKMLSQYALECGESLDQTNPNDTLCYHDALNKAIGEFLRTGLKSYTPAQLKLLLSKFKGKVEKLQKQLGKVVEKGMEIHSHIDIEALFREFFSAMSRLKTHHKLEGPKILEDFHALAPFYKDICNRSKQIKSEVLEEISNFARLFDKNDWTVADFETLLAEGLVYAKLINDTNRSKRAKGTPPPLHYPELVSLITAELGGIITQAGDKNIIFASVARECQEYTKRALRENDVFTHQDILVRMKEAIENPSFAKKVRNAFSAVVVDEFQDTDPLQWEIFSTLFLQEIHGWKGHLYLVGDPKQSIYSFRQADIYTYLTAGSQLQGGSIVTLDTNFRSHKLLIDGLNTLFSAMHCPFPLPQRQEGIPYTNVQAGKQLSLPFSDQKSCLLFWLTHEKSIPKGEYETAVIIPAVIKELISLEKQGISNRRCAILVKDHNQSNLIEEMLNEAGISVRKERGVHLGQTDAIGQLKDILKGIHRYKDRSDLVHALTTRLIGWNHADLLSLDEGESLNEVTTLCNELHDTLVEKGFACFYREFMNSRWKKEGDTVLNGLLRQKGAPTFLRNWQDVADMIALKQSQKNLSVEGLIEYIEELQQTTDSDEEDCKGYLDGDDEGVMLMTTHISKGLEFDVVFAVGLSKSYGGTDDLIPVTYVDEKGTTKHRLIPAVDQESPEYTLYREEVDAEKLRQLYVALTRARFRVYVPTIFNDKEETKNSMSPTELMVEALGGTEEGFCSFVESHSEVMGFEMLDGKQESLVRQHHQEYTLIKPSKIHFEHAPRIVQSFTSLTKKLNDHEGVEDAPSDVGSAPNAFDCEEKTAHTLPAGNHTGILLHTIYENINFAEVAKTTQPTEILPLIAPYIMGTPFEPWKHVVAEIVFNALKTPIVTGSDSFCLADVHSEKCFKEAEFMFMCDKRNLGTGIVSQEGFIKGVIDLFFEHKGRYYLLDWKSNWLGPALEDYSHENVFKALKENAYDIQAALYVEALEKYLRVVDPRPFSEIFGGAFYLFVRGNACVALG